MIKHIIAILLAFTTIMLSGCFLLPEEQEYTVPPVINQEQEASIEEEVVLRGDIVDNKTVSVKYQSSRKEEYSFKLSYEKITDVYVSLGDQVKKGQVLAELNAESLLEEIEALKTDLKKMNTDIEYYNNLIAVDPSNKDMYEQQKESYSNSIEASNQRMKELQAKINDRQIVAGMDGVVTYLKDFVEGDVSNEDTVYIIVSDNNKKIIGSCEKDDNFQIGNEYILETDEINYTVILSDINEVSENKLEVSFEFTEEVGVLDDSFKGKVIYETNEAIDVLYLPTSVVTILGDESFVYVRNEEGFRTKKMVKVGKIIGNNIVIEEGLEEDELVISN